MRAILDQLESMDREHKPAPTRLGIYGDWPRSRSQWRGGVRETATAFIGTLCLIPVLWVTVSGLIGCAQGMWGGVNDVCGFLLRVVGR